MIVRVHSVENCPGGNIKSDKAFATKLDEGMKKAGVKVLEGYLDALGHVWYFVVETDSNAALNKAVEPLRLI